MKFSYWYRSIMASLLAQTVKNHLQSRIPGFNPWGGEDPLEKEMETNSSILSGEFHGQEPGELWGPGDARGLKE